MAAADGTVIAGVHCKTYYDADGNIAVPTWVELTGTSGVQLPSKWTTAKVLQRSPRIELNIPVHLQIPVTVKLPRRPGNTAFDIFMTAHRTDAKIGIAVMSGLITDTGEYGVQYEAKVTEANDDQGHDGVEVVFTVEPDANYTTAPVFTITT